MDESQTPRQIWDRMEQECVSAERRAKRMERLVDHNWCSLVAKFCSHSRTKRLARLAPEIEDPAWVSSSLSVAEIEAVIAPHLHAYEVQVDQSERPDQATIRAAWVTLWNVCGRNLTHRMQERFFAILEKRGVIVRSPTSEPDRPSWLPAHREGSTTDSPPVRPRRKKS